MFDSCMYLVCFCSACPCRSSSTCLCYLVLCVMAYLLPVILYLCLESSECFELEPFDSVSFFSQHHTRDSMCLALWLMLSHWLLFYKRKASLELCRIKIRKPSSWREVILSVIRCENHKSPSSYLQAKHAHTSFLVSNWFQLGSMRKFITLKVL